MSVLLFLSFLLVQLQPVKADIESGQHDVTVASGGARNTYFPDVEKLQNGDLLVVYYDSPAHTSQSGRIAMVRSTDDGQTWSTPITVADSVYDDRDPSIMQMGDGTLLVNFFSTDWSQSPSKILGTYLIRSTDGGLTWSSPVLVETKLDYTATTSKILELDNGELLIPRYGKMPGHWQSKIMIGRSSDGGLSWLQANEVEIPNPYGTNWVEPALADLGGGHLMVMIRTAKYAHEAHSYDNGLSWTTPVPTDMEAHASNLLVLDQDGPEQKILHTWGDYSSQYAFGRPVVGQIILADGTPVSERVKMYAGHCGDESYPSSVRLDDGRIFTVYYDACAKQIRGTFSTVDDFLDYEPETGIWDSETGKLDLWKLYTNGSLQISTDMNYIHGYFHPHGSIDGNLSYLYSAAKVQSGGGSYWSIELDQAYPVSKIGIILSQRFPETANIYLSADGVNWGSPVASYDDVIMNQMEYIVFEEPVFARYAKVEILESNGTDILCEFSLFVSPETGTVSSMLDQIGQHEQAGEINTVFADQLAYRLTVIQQLVAQKANVEAVAYMQDFLQTINAPSVLEQRLISERAAAALSTEASLFIQFQSAGTLPTEHVTVERLRTDVQEQRSMSVVTYGDSWTYGSVAEGWYEARDAGYDASLISGSWSMQLKSELMQLNPYVQFYNKGVGGMTSVQGSNNYAANVGSLSPDYLILNFGINDWRKGVTPAQFSAAMEAMIGQARSAGSEVILWTSGPLSIRSQETYGWARPVEDAEFAYDFSEYTAVLHDLAEEHDLLLADAAKDIEYEWQSGTDISGWFYDAIHFKQEGHDMILNSIKQTLRMDTLGH